MLELICDVYLMLFMLESSIDVVVCVVFEEVKMDGTEDDCEDDYWGNIAEFLFGNGEVKFILPDCEILQFTVVFSSLW